MTRFSKAARINTVYAVNMSQVASGSPLASRKGSSVYHEHSGQKFVVRATKVSLRRSNGIHYIGHRCPICGFQLNDTGRRLKMEALQRLLTA